MLVQPLVNLLGHWIEQVVLALEVITVNTVAPGWIETENAMGYLENQVGVKTARRPISGQLQHLRPECREDPVLSG